MFHNTKASKLEDYIKINNLSSAFNIDYQKENVAFIINDIINGIGITCLIIIDGGLRSDVVITFEASVDPNKKGLLLNVINDFHLDNLLLRIWISDENNVITAFPYITTDEDFNADTLVHIAWMGMKIVAEELYPVIMRANWS